MAVTDLMNQTISVENPSSTRDKQGNLGFGSSSDISARAERTNKIIATKEDEKTPIHLVLGVAPTDTVEIGAKVTYDSDEYRVLTREEAIDGDGDVHYIELMCQLWSF